MRYYFFIFILTYLVKFDFATSQIVINEIMPAPKQGEPEWIELYNFSDTPFKLDSILICDAIACKEIRSGTIRPNSFLVICADSNFLRNTYDIPVEATFIQINFPVLNNTSDQVVLRYNDGSLIDSAYYNMSYGKSGKSLERIYFDKPAISQSNWAVPIGNIIGTPGKSNSNKPEDCYLNVHNFAFINDTISINIQSNCNDEKRFNLLLSISKYHNENIEFEDVIFDEENTIFPSLNNIINYSLSLSSLHNRLKKGRHFLNLRLDNLSDLKTINQTIPIDLGIEKFDIIINEIMFDPSQNGSEYIELYNNTASTISLENWRLYDAAGSFNSKYLHINHLEIVANDYFVIAADTGIFNQFPNLKYSENLRIIKSNLVLNNSGDLIVICNPTGKVIDSLYFSSKWHESSLTNTKGISLERISPNAESNSHSSWSSSSDPRGGTPAEQNTLNFCSYNGILEITPNPFNPAKHSYFNVHYELPFKNARLSAYIFNELGAKVAELANNIFVHSSGIIRIEDKDLNMNNLIDGLYILFIEAISTDNGATHTNRAVLVVKN